MGIVVAIIFLVKKYFLVFITTIKEYCIYRLNFILWRVRAILSLFVTFFLWSAVLEKKNSFLHYQKPAFISYLLIAHIISTFIFGTRTVDIAAQINDGSIINYLLKPVSFFRLYFTKDLADKIINLFFSIIEIGLVIIFFKAPFSLSPNYLLFTIFIINALFISFFVNLMLSFIGFWTTEVWAPRFLFMMLVFFSAGYYFPLDILPQPLYQVVLTTPFAYLFYLPSKTFLGYRDSNQLLLFQLGFSFFWAWASWKLAVFMWKKGNKSFSFWAR